MSTTRRLTILLAVLTPTLAIVAACNKPKVAPRPRTVAPEVVRDVPQPLRNTIGAQARLLGVTPGRVSGIGFVVGLSGTGGLPLQENIAAHLEREMSLNGIGQAGSFDGTPLAGKSPRDLLSDKNTAAVIVEAAVPPGAREGDTFDLYVRALNATSLEGGRLWTTPLRAGPPSAFGNPQARIVGEARGPIFINPFAEPGSETDGVRRTVGRVLDGGVMKEPLEINVVLDNPSHARARLITSALNSAFPRRTGDRDPTARGRDDQVVTIYVPFRFRDRRNEFVRLVEHLPVDQSFPEEYARRYAQAMQDQPGLAAELGWTMQALGDRALPFLRDLYETTEAGPRLAALRAGANLADPQAAEPLMRMAQSGPAALRTDAIELLGRTDAGPRVEQTLVGLLDAPELTVRIAAYEALASRAEQAQRRRLLMSDPTGIGSRISLGKLEVLSRARLPRGTLQRVSREPVAEKFLLDRVPAGDGLIYVTQQGTPRIVLFGENVELPRPLLAGIWSDRLLLASDSESDPVRVFYRDARTGRAINTRAPSDLEGLIRFMAKDMTPESPEPGLGMSYSEVVGALYELSRAGAIPVAFATERDKLLAELLKAGEADAIEVRPEGPEDESEVFVFPGLDDPRSRPVPRPTGERRNLLVPLTTPAQSEGGPATPVPTTDEPAGRPE